ncbi:hypothetical protein [Chromobacterium sp. ATCC 53434]|uniref:hypothetical protein n=1 Tax=Chromobacterium sp. (strain ATCC 53434 / SC 14030) TaxID=2059672 RepID=UPI0018F2283B|nr:hypothetical protein [Chromobacterium sp. ATCC 53434]
MLASLPRHRGDRQRFGKPDKELEILQGEFCHESWLPKIPHDGRPASFRPEPLAERRRAGEGRADSGQKHVKDRRMSSAMPMVFLNVNKEKAESNQ